MNINYSIYKLYNLNLKIRIDKFISKNIKNISRSYIKKLILNNNVFINGKNLFNYKLKLKSNEKIEIYLPIKKYNLTDKKNFLLNIIYEDNDLIIINKESNTIIDYKNINNNRNSNSILNRLIEYNPNLINISRYGIVHRLDKNTTGLMIFAKTELAFKNLKKMFFLKKILKEYDAIITGSLMFSDTISLPILKNNKSKKMIINFELGKKSITHYRIINKLNLHTHIKVLLETGRTHQIRTHMSYIGHPIVGDLKYSNNCSNYKKSLNLLLSKNIIFNRQALHSSKLEFNHPINNKKLTFKIDLPNDIKLLLFNIKN